ncbi:MAG TPA: hypothetical protein VEH57_09470 [Thermoplasmata archaeon]|nr:hypothetical protein [Thermoplasmata archaeon]
MGEELDRLERMLLLHLLEHRGQQVRFEASQWTTEFGIVRKFSGEDTTALKQALRVLEIGRLIYRRTQYVVGYSEPKHVFSLTPSGHRKALEYAHDTGPMEPTEGLILAAESPSATIPPTTDPTGTESPTRRHIHPNGD